MPTGWRSEYLAPTLAHGVSSASREKLLLPVPAGDLECGTEDLRTHEFRHLEAVARWLGRSRWCGWRTECSCHAGREVGGLAFGVGLGLRSQWRKVGCPQAKLDKLLFTRVLEGKRREA